MSDQSPPVVPAPALVAADAALDIRTNELTPAGIIRTRVSARYIWFLILATFGSFAALVAPIGISLALRVQELAPENVEVLGYVVGAGAFVSAISTPLVGMWSDRTRSRFGRRRPFAIGGAVLGVLGLAFLAWAPTIALVIAGWMITQLGWSTVLGSLLFSQADRLPEEQRGKVAGLSGMVQMIASVFGVGVASAFIGSNFLVFLVPGFIGLLMVGLWVLLVKESSSLEMEFGPRPRVGTVIANLVFNPRRYSDFGWNWLGRLLFNFGVTFATTFTTLFFAARLSEGGQVADIGGLIVILSLLGVVATAGGAFLGGFLSDKLKRRRIFVLLAGFGFTAGAIVMAFGGSNAVLLFTGSLVTSLGLGIFSAVDQAIVLDVLPERDTEAGRFLGINNYATSIAQALAPIIAVPLLLIGVTGADKNYGVLFLVASACTLVGGTVIMVFVRGSK
ncbi:Major Facilitator Superfamily protein [Microbacterium sp. cf046]|uniref:MFS transporter n=1 Tax=Microbacterium sp. cf046 TaxID=1761803 RepID=UPI0008E7DB39|nr:MFS transporter [Microbacterium sp. cf046]SFS16918.1 Major Facilitator Superfamily protein [Microbacterium sp. cf046]